jgi:hypothetical protein
MKTVANTTLPSQSLSKPYSWHKNEKRPSCIHALGILMEDQEEDTTFLSMRGKCKGQLQKLK